MLIAYHGKESNKTAILQQLAAHREADRLVQRGGYWDGEKGCSIGCTIQSGDHIEFENRFGIPVEIARLEDSIFERLPVPLARQWPERLMSSIRVGSDLSLVHWHLLHWMLTDADINPGIHHSTVKNAVQQCAEVISDLAAGVPPSEIAADAENAERAAKEAMDALDAWNGEATGIECSSAGAAYWFAKSATVAASSGRRASAIWVADGVGQTAGWRRTDAWTKISDKLIELVIAAPDAVAD